MRSTAHDNCHVKCTMEYTFFLLQELPKICTYLCTTLRSTVWNVFCGVKGEVWRKISLYGIFMPYSGAKWVLKPCKNCAGKLTFGKVNKLFIVKLCGMTGNRKGPLGEGAGNVSKTDVCAAAKCRGRIWNPPLRNRGIRSHYRRRAFYMLPRADASIGPYG